jgi:hypothetical protein
MNILPKFAPETARKQDAFGPYCFALHDMQLTMIQISTSWSRTRANSALRNPRINRELDYDHDRVGRVARVPNGFVKTDQLMIGEEFRKPLLYFGRSLFNPGRSLAPGVDLR